VQGFHHRGEFDPPEWANNLKNYYWHIRVEGRDKAKRRRYYRLISKEKLRLAEKSINQEIINAVCKYLCVLDASSGKRLHSLLEFPPPQLQLDF
jgi:hypothetical protein